jgi:hypothetical protein
VLGGELLFELVDRDFKIHGLRISVRRRRSRGLSEYELSSVVRNLSAANANGLTLGCAGQRMTALSASCKFC